MFMGRKRQRNAICSTPETKQPQPLSPSSKTAPASLRGRGFSASLLSSPRLPPHAHCYPAQAERQQQAQRNDRRGFGNGGRSECKFADILGGSRCSVPAGEADVSGAAFQNRSEVRRVGLAEAAAPLRQIFGQGCPIVAHKDVNRTGGIQVHCPSAIVTYTIWLSAIGNKADAAAAVTAIDVKVKSAVKLVIFCLVS